MTAANSKIPAAKRAPKMKIPGMKKKSGHREEHLTSNNDLSFRHGWLTCWDLRFRLPITSWQSDRTEPITCLSPSLACSSTINVGIKGYNEVRSLPDLPICSGKGF
eukprot:sb/3477843/